MGQQGVSPRNYAKHVRNVASETALKRDWNMTSKWHRKTRERALKDLKLRISTANTSLREREDLIKLNFLKDSLEANFNNFKTIHENMTDLLIRLELIDTEQTTPPWSVSQTLKQILKT